MARAILLIDSALANGEIGELIHEPILCSADTADLLLTSDQWAYLLRQRRCAGRCLHLAEVR